MQTATAFGRCTTACRSSARPTTASRPSAPRRSGSTAPRRQRGGQVRPVGAPGPGRRARRAGPHRPPSRRADALGDLEVDVAHGEALLVTGSSGSGKTRSCAASPASGRRRGQVRRPLGRAALFLSHNPTSRWPAAGRAALPGGGRHPRRRPSRPCSARYTAARRRPARRGDRLEPQALARRTAAPRLRAGAGRPAEGGVPRRGHLRRRRAHGGRSVPAAARRTARHGRRQRGPPPQPGPFHAARTGTGR